MLVGNKIALVEELITGYCAGNYVRDTHDQAIVVPMKSSLPRLRN